ncbi:MAG: hypothetical protein LR008_00225 [Candidatus Pacebacteria bacterium]|nr:hypothetical protein [Candidatus Paceibacterota bacterium]
MDPVTYASTSTVSTSDIIIPAVGYDFITPLIGFFGGNDTFSAASNFGGLFDFLGSVWSVYVVLAYIVSILLLVMYVYASVRKNLYLDLETQGLRDMERMYDEQYRGGPRASRLEDILKHSNSENPNDWKLAIIEADIILDNLLKERGYAGKSLGERLKSISPQQLRTLNEAWEAHKIRNRIAHDGPDFVLTKRLMQETIGKYRLVFNEFDIV